MIESGAGESSSYSDKEYSDAGASNETLQKYLAVDD
jgi:NAD/NADP transhydrogenase alpha subunit